MFDIDFYLASTDVFLTVTTEKRAKLHYKHIGRKYNYLGSEQEFWKLYPEFDYKFYISNYSDIDHFTLHQAMHHYHNHGKMEGRICSQNKLDNNLKKLNVILENDMEEKNMNTVSIKNNIHFNILIRTSNRRNYFEKCVNSILNQEYENYQIYVSYDDDKSLKYLDKYSFINLIKTEKTNEDFFYNNHCNVLLDSIKKDKNEWIIFLDDDDMFVRFNVLGEITKYIENDNSFIYWKYMRPDKIIFDEKTKKELIYGKISTCSACFCSIHKDTAKWKIKRGGDYSFFKDLVDNNNLDIIYVNHIFTKTIHHRFISQNGEQKIEHINEKTKKEQIKSEIQELNQNDPNVKYFDEEFYQKTYSDLNNVKHLFNHYCSHGIKEKRITFDYTKLELNEDTIKLIFNEYFDSSLVKLISLQKRTYIAEICGKKYEFVVKTMNKLLYDIETTMVNLSQIFDHMSDEINIIIPVWKRRPLLLQCIKSLRKYIKSTLFLVSNKKDLDFMIENKYNYLITINKPLGRKRNNGVKYLLENYKSKYIMLFDSDDCLSRLYIKNSIQTIELHKYDMIGTDIQYLDINGDLYRRQFNFRKCIKLGFPSNNFTFGSGRIYTFNILQELDGNLYDSMLSKALDRTSLINLLKCNAYIGCNRRMPIYSYYDSKTHISDFDKMEIDSDIFLINIDLDFYKNLYLNSKRLSKDKLKRHWELCGWANDYLCDKTLLSKIYPKFDWEFYLHNNHDLNTYDKYFATCHFWSHGCFEDRLYHKLDHINIKKSKFDFKDMKEIDKSITQCYISKSLNIGKQVFKNYGFSKYVSLTKPTLFIGLYDDLDISTLKLHKGKKYVAWGGTDSDLRFKRRIKNMEFIKTLKNISHYAISVDIYERLLHNGIESELIFLNSIDESLFKKLDKLGKSIYVYNGNSHNNKLVYGQNFIDKVMKSLPEYNYIVSSRNYVPYEEMPEIYQKCFIGLRLTKHDGNANTVREMSKIGLPVVHNGMYNTLKWENELDVIRWILISDMDRISKNNQIDCSKWRNINNNNLKVIYEQLSLFIKLLRTYDKILVVCSEYPGFGGAATHSYKMIKYLRKLGVNIKGLFYTQHKCEFEFDDYIDIIRDEQLQYYLDDVYSDIDLVILRNFVPYEVELKFDDIWFMIPGIFVPGLDKKYEKVNNEKYIHKKILNSVSKCRLNFCNSYHTTTILEKFVEKDIRTLYFGLIPYIGEYINECKDKREYDIGVIVSDFTRKVKNIDSICNDLGDENVVFIGKNSKMYEKDNISCYELLHPDKVIEFIKKIRTIKINSNYESCSNVMLEALFNGCKIST